MSRSYKKSPVIKDMDSGRFGKRLANKKVRRFKNDIKSGKSYKKIFETYNIHDFVSRYSYKDYLKKHKPEDEKEVYEKWAKYYKRK